MGQLSRNVNGEVVGGSENELLTGVVLGLYCNDTDIDGSHKYLTKAGVIFNERVDNKLMEMIDVAGPVPRKDETRLFYGLDPKIAVVSLVGLGDDCVSYSESEGIDESKEVIRSAAGYGVRSLQTVHAERIFIESFGHAESSAEGAAMGVWMYQEHKAEHKRKKIPRLELYEDCDYTGWQIGLQKAAAQNLARQLTETAANILTPLSFSQIAVDILGRANINIEVKASRWSQMTGMEAFLAAARGSCEPPVFLEASYYGCDMDIAPIILVGKGVTFDSGGLCLKSCPDLEHGKTNMSGAAIVISVIRAVAALQLPLNVRCLIPLFENMPGTGAYRPGDIIRAKNGKTVIVEDTDFDGRISLIDAIAYSGQYNPKFILDIGQMSTACRDALGQAATIAFSNNRQLFEQMRIAGIHTGDRVWEFPLWEYFGLKVTNNPKADTGDLHETNGAPCTCAAFLHEFVPKTDWIHLDTYGVSRTDGNTWPYLRRGASGRPTRTIVEFLASLACKSEGNEENKQNPKEQAKNC